MDKLALSSEPLRLHLNLWPHLMWLAASLCSHSTWGEGTAQATGGEETMLDIQEKKGTSSNCTLTQTQS